MNVSIKLNQDGQEPFVHHDETLTDDSKPSSVEWSARDVKLLKAYFQQCAKYDEFFMGFDDLDDSQVQQYMLNGGLAYRDKNGRVFLTQSGVLLCCKREFIPRNRFHVHVKFQQKGDIDLIEEIWGSVLFLYFELYSRLQPFFHRRMGTPTQRDSIGGEKIFYEYPEIAIVEALVNFLIHRDYSNDDMGFLTVYPDKIEFMNPGKSAISPSELLTTTIPFRPIYKRNPRLIEAMNKARLNQREGGGILRIRIELEKNKTYLLDGKLGIEINNIESDNRFMLTIHKKRLDADAPEKEYLEWLREISGAVTFRGIEQEGRQVVVLPMETTYVPLSLKTNDIESTSIKEILSLSKRLVIIGEPGSGKSSILLHVANTLAKSLLTNNPQLATEIGLKDDEIPLPVLLPLGAYANYLRNLSPNTLSQDRTLINFASHYFNVRGFSLNIPSDFFSARLRDGHPLIFLLDGLDEVFNESERIYIRQAVEDLVVGRERIRVILTARSVAYQGQAVLGRDFQQARILPINDNQLQAIVKQAYSAIYPESQQRALKMTENLLKQIQILEEARNKRFGNDIQVLFSTPLMIRMLLVVFFNNRRLPSQRADLYSKVVDVMLRPDYSLDESVAQELGHRISGSLAMNREMLQALAFNMHKLGAQFGREIDENALRNILSQYPEYANFVDELIIQTTQRGTLLVEHAGVYRFIQLSFQEFLTARYIVEVIREPNLIVNFLADEKILDIWWREPILLAINYLDLVAPTRAPRVIEAFMGVHKQTHDFSPRVQFAFAEIATTACTEQENVSLEFRKELIGQVTRIIQNDLLQRNVEKHLVDSLESALYRLKSLVDLESLNLRAC